MPRKFLFVSVFRFRFYFWNIYYKPFCIKLLNFFCFLLVILSVILRFNFCIIYYVVIVTYIKFLYAYIFFVEGGLYESIIRDGSVFLLWSYCLYLRRTYCRICFPLIDIYVKICSKFYKGVSFILIHDKSTTYTFSKLIF